VEALVSLVLAGGAIAALVTTIGETDKAEARTLQAEKLQRLAHQKLDEIIATQDFNSQGGDFADQGQPNIQWTMTDDSTGVENLDQVIVTVTQDESDSTAQTVQTLLYKAPQTGTTGANP
jgi:type II secretory pathway pseudopilin PulG